MDANTKRILFALEGKIIKDVKVSEDWCGYIFTFTDGTVLQISSLTEPVTPYIEWLK